jgi:hypothetical protein
MNFQFSFKGEKTERVRNFDGGSFGKTGASKTNTEIGRQY